MVDARQGASNVRSLRELMDLSGRVALITGGAGHIAEAFAEALAELGAELCLLDIAEDRLRQRAESLGKMFRRKTTSVVADISREDHVQRAVAQLLEQHGGLDIVVNNAAYPPPDPSSTPDSLAEWDANLRVMLGGTFLVTRACAPALQKSKGRAIVNVASHYAIVGPDFRLYEGLDMKNEAFYAAGKGGIVQLTRYYATQLAPEVRVNCVAPGGVFRDQPEKFVKRYAQRTPMARMGKEEDLKGAIAYLASDLSAYVTGQVLLVDGGFTTW